MAQQPTAGETEVANPHEPTTEELTALRDECVAELTRMQGLAGQPYVQQIIVASIEQLEAEIAALDAAIEGGGPPVEPATVRARVWL